MPTTSKDLSRVMPSTPPNREQVTAPLAPGVPTPDLPPPSLGPSLESPEHARAQKVLKRVSAAFEEAVAVFMLTAGPASEVEVVYPVVLQVGTHRLSRDVSVKVTFTVTAADESSK